jgi:PhoH-like ATPase
MRKIIVDTNLLLDDAKVLDKLSKEYDKIVIPLVVLKELDKHKLNPDTSYSARNAIYAILNFKEKNKDKLIFAQNSNEEIDNNDSKIIDTAIRTGSDIATKDISMSIISEAKGINTLLYDVVINNLFNPYIYIEMDEVLETYKEFCFNQLYEGYDYKKLTQSIRGLDKNAWMFIFIRHENEIKTVYAHNPIKECFERVDNLPNYRKMEVDNAVIKALDIYQVCAFYAFKEAPNILLTGKWGSGKTLLGTSYAIQNSNRKIFITRPPVGINRKFDVGFFPGDKDEKMLNWFAGFLSSVYYIYANTRGQHNGTGIEYDYVKDKIFKEKFETVPINAIQGMSLLNEDILIVDELQLIDVDYLSMILSRSGSGSKIILLGDLAQTYGVVRPSESGLLKLLRLLPHKNIAYVSLQNSYRSGLLDLADKLQEKIIN